MIYHPRKNEHGQKEPIRKPSVPTSLEAWHCADQIATVIPDGAMPGVIAGIPVTSWDSVPTDSDGWEALTCGRPFEEPALKAVPGKRPASGGVILEPDGRVWVVSPTNQYAGYVNTFPKGKIDAGSKLSLRANAIKEVYEESGLFVELTGFLCDSVRSLSVTRYFLGRRVGGSPADMGWETQAVHLVPLSKLAGFAAHANDQAIANALRATFPQR